jgi:hypothetical protein
MPDDASRQGASRRATLTVLAGLFLGTLALRPQLVGIGPLLPQIQADLGMSHAVAGLLAAIPVFLMGLFAPLGPWVSGRIGPRDALALCMVGIIGFGLLRPALPGVPAILLTTIGIGIGIGTAGALLPIVVRMRAPDEPARATGFYAAGIVAGSLFAAAAAIPLAEALGGWRATLVVFAFLGVGSLAAWLFFLRPDPAAQRATGRPSRLPWRSTTAVGARSNLRVPVAAVLLERLMAAGHLHRARLERGRRRQSRGAPARGRPRRRHRRAADRGSRRDEAEPAPHGRPGHARRVHRYRPCARRRVPVGGRDRARDRCRLPARADATRRRLGWSLRRRRDRRVHAVVRIRDLELRSRAARGPAGRDRELPDEPVAARRAVGEPAACKPRAHPRHASAAAYRHWNGSRFPLPDGNLAA